MTTHMQMSFLCSFCFEINNLQTVYVSGSSVSLPSNVSLCEPCDSACKEGLQ